MAAGRRARQRRGDAVHRHLRALSRHRPRRRPRADALLRTAAGVERRRDARGEDQGRRAEHGDAAVQGHARRSADLAARRLHPHDGGEPEGQAGLRARSEQPDHQVRAADVPDRSRRAGARDAVGPRVPSRRPPARDRTSRAPAHHRQRQAPAGCRAGHAEGVGTAGLRDAGRRDSSAVREERLDLSRLHRGGPRIRGAAAATRRRAGRSGGGRRRARQGTRWAAQPSVDDGLRPRQDRQEQPLGRGAGHLPRALRPLYPQRFALRHPVPVRQGPATCSTAWASAAT